MIILLTPWVLLPYCGVPSWKLDTTNLGTCAADTASKIDAHVVTIVKSAHEKARRILKENESKLHELANRLLEKETITGEEFMALLNR